jgi:hypothetical protein
LQRILADHFAKGGNPGGRETNLPLFPAISAKISEHAGGYRTPECFAHVASDFIPAFPRPFHRFAEDPPHVVFSGHCPIFSL